MSDTDFIPQMRPLFGADERAELLSYLDEDGFFTEFKRTEAFEAEIARYTGARHCVVVNNGTVSLTLAAAALGIGPGDEVICPDYTMIATPNSVQMLGAKPVFVDVEPDTLVMDVALAERAITPRTKAIMLVSANGRAPRAGIATFEALSQRTGIALIEDAAQSLGSWYADGRHVGRAGRIGSFSFSAPKIISTGQGGALITDDDALAARLRKLKDFGRSGGGNDVHDSIGWNFKFTELQACVGLAQMRQLPDRVVRKKAIWRRYAERLAGVSGYRLFDHDLALCTPWFIDGVAERRDELAAHLKARGIGTRTMYPPIHRQKAYDLPGDHPVAEHIGRDGLWLPSMIQLTDAQIDRICGEIAAFYG
ncbi:DegT/DnrJ/EryC1/StrS family aminotransferase [Aquabacterium sp. OR-4]|uniref:DegT/DnrJ/EryC1/StrS family aminotransferase n=1 Tax=Aquabacterium sp. OR-4 TaxID=2978127 RepID=UPI0021B38CDD|nr:DegT/DnrJ/EryC1/StrS family aminotransferase [Aquabacterium sp. OR-4]MDT7836545.1 DegT/DnrJ/EryC1/StrS family aminotransferase [Aquabacterium sp. OR-4]